MKRCNIKFKYIIHFHHNTCDTLPSSCSTLSGCWLFLITGNSKMDWLRLLPKENSPGEVDTRCMFLSFTEDAFLSSSSTQRSSPENTYLD